MCRSCPLAQQKLAHKVSSPGDDAHLSTDDDFWQHLTVQAQSCEDGDAGQPLDRQVIGRVMSAMPRNGCLRLAMMQPCPRLMTSGSITDRPGPQNLKMATLDNHLTMVLFGV
ncbi:hypothetical protein NP493_1837g00000 [Ridgeia piscesae]|uniref:Uncharacterized protein n=1 Tax=Ridgeia piscesae TaxID=27915 RepID=A0AAD9N8C3_RIDPI|nr:hypothetical protein NP493_1837g00000 [Ridgeia piscesae]